MNAAELTTLRAEKDAFFKSHPQSPLTREQKQTFTNLPYFPPNAALDLVVQVEEFATKEQVTMQTSTGSTQIYEKFGRFDFEVEGQTATLTLYASEHGFFLPFVDALAGAETYGAGRYLEPEPLAGGQFRVDFNSAYNPYCAYNERWSCPIPPRENRLKVPIRAGEKIFDTPH